jgi:hypothetical protein
VKTFKLKVTVTQISEATTDVDAETLEAAKQIAEGRARGGSLLYSPAPVTAIEIEEVTRG